ncbi:MAG: hypothetical protein C5B50_24625 [Verrucomicrobia bacterium]|nr:MAG: hypothetical protein C5B50_24625 [Verrucomicrobiota bacterium]
MRGQGCPRSELTASHPVADSALSAREQGQVSRAAHGQAAARNLFRARLEAERARVERIPGAPGEAPPQVDVEEQTLSARLHEPAAAHILSRGLSAVKRARAGPIPEAPGEVRLPMGVEEQIPAASLALAEATTAEHFPAPIFAVLPPARWTEVVHNHAAALGLSKNAALPVLAPGQEHSGDSSESPARAFA